MKVLLHMHEQRHHILSVLLCSHLIPLPLVCEERRTLYHLPQKVLFRLFPQPIDLLLSHHTSQKGMDPFEVISPVNSNVQDSLPCYLAVLDDLPSKVILSHTSLLLISPAAL